MPASRTTIPTLPAWSSTSAATGLLSIALPLRPIAVQEATIPFVGLTPDTGSDYPDPVSPVGDRFDATDPLSFREAIQCLPQTGEGQLWADNEFVAPTDTGSVDVDLEAIRNVHGLVTARLEELAGRSLVQLAADAAQEPLIRVDDHKVSSTGAGSRCTRWATT